MLKHDQKKWRRLYRRIIQSCFKTVRGTPRIQKFLQLGTYPLTERMNILVSQYYSRMLRAPRTGQLHRLIRFEWWDYLTDCWEPLALRQSREKTVIWHIDAVAARFRNDDYVHLRRLPGNDIDLIPNNMSHFFF